MCVFYFLDTVSLALLLSKENLSEFDSNLTSFYPTLLVVHTPASAHLELEHFALSFMKKHACALAKATFFLGFF